MNNGRTFPAAPPPVHCRSSRQNLAFQPNCVHFVGATEAFSDRIGGDLNDRLKVGKMRSAKASSSGELTRFGTFSRARMCPENERMEIYKEHLIKRDESGMFV